MIYNCTCVFFSVLDVCAINNLICSYTCDNNTANGEFVCICKAGYELAADGSNCTSKDNCYYKYYIIPQNKFVIKAYISISADNYQC